MTTRTTVWCGVGATCAAALASLATYGSLPEQVPIHWNASGQVDGYASKIFGSSFMPVGMAVLLLLLFALPWLSPKNFKVEPFQGVFNYVMLVLIGLFLYIHGIMLDSALHPGQSFAKPMIGGLFVFFGLIGNMLGKVKRNFWMGIRVPWTLASDAVWDATHRFAARLVVVASFAGAIGVFFGVPIAWAFWVVIAAFIVPVFYSAWLSKRLEGETGDAS